MNLKVMELDCANKECNSRDGPVMVFCYHGNKHSSFKRAVNFVSNFYLPYYMSCVGFSLRMLHIVIGHCILKLL